MGLTIDDIYDLFIWDSSYADEEYEKRQSLGIAEASKLKNLYPFIMPTVNPREKSKSVWESCAKVVAQKTDDELMQYLGLLFEWLQDMNWQGADIIYDRLLQIPFLQLESDYNLCLRMAEKTNDQVWIEVLKDFKIDSIKNI